MKGTISKDLHAILHDDEGRKQLRRSLIKRTDAKVTVGDTKYRVSSKSTDSIRIRDTEKSTLQRALDFFRRTT